jgi:hypothetical protein
MQYKCYNTQPFLNSFTEKLRNLLFFKFASRVHLLTYYQFLKLTNTIHRIVNRIQTFRFILFRIQTLFFIMLYK